MSSFEGAIAMRMLISWCLVVLAASASPAQAQQVIYMHTDALGSVVLETDANRETVGLRSEYEPYGLMLAGSINNEPGYTGHVQDTATGLVYMQQRYYDPSIGRFLSVDPVSANRHRGSNFNRYWYADNNPYRFTDPDGRLAREKEEPPPPPDPEPEPTTLGTVTVTATRPAPGSRPTAIPWGGIGRSLVQGGSIPLTFISGMWPYDMGYAACETQGPGACGRVMSEMGETAPSDAPPGTLPLDKAKGKFGLDKDTLHGVKDAATGGMGTGKTWVGVAPDRTVGTSEGGRWTPQGTLDELQP